MMNARARNKFFTLTGWRFWGWITLLALTIASLSLVEQRSLSTKLASESTILHRLSSQRADQHDAHLTSLSAVATAGGDIRRDLFLDVANTILRFYPRIVSVDLVLLSDISKTISTGGQTEPKLAAIIAMRAKASDGALQLDIHPENRAYYLLIKRSPNSAEAKYALALTIDASSLIESDAAFWKSPSVHHSLSLPDGTIIAGAPGPAVPAFSKPLGSKSQPLLLEVSAAPPWDGILPWKKIGLAAALVSIAYFLALSALQQLLRTRKAERLAMLSAQETRLAHASRVNALGEMASGLAHELTQPLTAILSQTQAGKHLARNGDLAAVTSILDDTITQAKRASAILGRMRRWTKPATTTPVRNSIEDAANVVNALLKSAAAVQGAELVFDLGQGAGLAVNADSVELEQVIFNLVRNALDAVAKTQNAKVEIRGYHQSGWVILEVSDNGPGVAANVKERLFEPFVTDKTEGTGLGLALCRRLVEGMGGEITLLNATRTVFQVRLPMAQDAAKVAAQ